MGSLLQVLCFEGRLIIQVSQATHAVDTLTVMCVKNIQPLIFTAFSCRGVGVNARCIFQASSYITIHFKQTVDLKVVIQIQTIWQSKKNERHHQTASDFRQWAQFETKEFF